MVSRTSGGFSRKRRRTESGSAIEVAQTAVRIARKTARDTRGEHKHIDGGGSGTAGTGAVSLVLRQVNADVDEGDQGNERDGLTIKMDKFDMRMSMKCPFIVSTGERYTVRLAVILDTGHGNLVSPNWTDVFETLTVYSPLKRLALGRFTVLVDKTITQNTTGFDVERFFRVSKKLNTICRYTGPLGGTITKNRIWFMVLGDNATASPLMTWEFRLSYTDM